MKHILQSCVLVALITGCSTVSVSTRQDIASASYPATVASTVQILQTPPNVAHVRLGEITAEPAGNPTKEMIQAKFQQAAAAMGANAVVIVADQTRVMGAYVTGPWWGRQVQTTTGRVIIGVAIRYLP
ncbi:MAG: hypothetical protein WCS70_13395 [Verrucomicrobiota bacterium]